jgi:hypothetical protein
MLTARDVLNESYERVAVTRRAHYLSADHFGTRKLSLGIPAVVLSALTVDFAVFTDLNARFQGEEIGRRHVRSAVDEPLPI